VAKISLNHKVGFMDKSGKEIVTPKYDYTVDFKEGLSGVKLNEKEFYIKVFPEGKIVEYYDE